MVGTCQEGFLVARWGLGNDEGNTDNRKFPLKDQADEYAADLNRRGRHRRVPQSREPRRSRNGSRQARIDAATSTLTTALGKLITILTEKP